MRAELNCLQRLATRRLNEWRNDQWIATQESLDPEDKSLCRTTKKVVSLYSIYPCSPREEKLADSEKAEALADSLETHI